MNVCVGDRVSTDWPEYVRGRVGIVTECDKPIAQVGTLTPAFCGVVEADFGFIPGYGRVLVQRHHSHFAFPLPAPTEDRHVE